MANAFFVRCDCRNRRFTGGKSRFLQEADGRKGIASAADELCGSALHSRILSDAFGNIDGIISGGEPIMKRTLPALLLCGVLLFSVPALTEDTLLRSLFGWTAYFARIPADAADTPDTLEWDWTWNGFWRALFGYSA